MLDKFITLVTVADSSSYTEAAKKLFCSQPTVTQHIQQLEQYYDAKLIVRQNRTYELTKQGEVVVAYARRILQLEQNMLNELEIVNNKSEVIPIFVSHYFAANFFSLLFNYPTQQAPEANPFEIHSYNYKDLKNALLNREAKFVVMPIYNDPEIVQGFDTEVLFEEEILLAVHKEHRLASRKKIYARDLSGEQILLPQSVKFQQIVKQALKQKEVETSYIQMTSFELIEKAVEQQLGLAFIPIGLEVPEDKEHLVYRRIEGLSLVRGNGLVIQKNIQLTSQEIAFCNRLKEQFS